MSAYIPEADGPDDTTLREIHLDGGSAQVEHFPDGHAELFVKIGDRLAAALILSSDEAEHLGLALARPYGLTVTDYFELTDAMEVPR